MNYNLKVLIIKSDKNQRAWLKKQLRDLGFDNVADVADGAAALDIAESFVPDVVVTDIWLEQINGIRLVKSIREFAPNTAFVLWASDENEVICRAMVAGTNDKYVLGENCCEEIAKAIIETYLETKRAQAVLPINEKYSCTCDSNMAIKAYVSEILRSFGMNVSLKGYKYARFAIMTALAFELENYRLTRFIYPQTAIFFKTTASRVERDIRHAVQSVFATGNRMAVAKYFPEVVSDELYCPTNGEFIAVMCDRLAMELKSSVKNVNAEQCFQIGDFGLNLKDDNR